MGQRGKGRGRLGGKWGKEEKEDKGWEANGAKTKRKIKAGRQVGQREQ